MTPISRRELLAAFLGLPVALAACRENRVPPLPAGEIVGASDAFGHRLRDGLRVEVPSDAWTDVPVVIVGGGVAGLSAAWHLQRSGFDDFVLIEARIAMVNPSSANSFSPAIPRKGFFTKADGMRDCFCTRARLRKTSSSSSSSTRR